MVKYLKIFLVKGPLKITCAKHIFFFTKEILSEILEL